MTWLYNFGIAAYKLAAKLAALSNEKAKLWVQGRVGLLETIELNRKNQPPCIWVHCPSLGEFEQGRPVIESLKEQFPQTPIILTFFSPSGYEVRKNYTGVDAVFYLPIDNKQNAFRFITAIQPQLAIFIKYDFWLHYLSELKRINCPSILVSGVFRPNQHFFKPWGGVGKTMLSCFSHLFVQDKQSQALLTSIGIINSSISGDTRFDRVVSLYNQSEQIELAEIFCGNKFTVVAGSTWPQDNSGLISWINNNTGCKLIIAPHEINEDIILGIENSLKVKSVRFSATTKGNLLEANVLIIDNFGMLSKLYRYASVAYVGGGFGHGIHNTLEAAVWGIPIIFGPKYEKFNEALSLVKIGAAFVCEKIEHVEKCIAELEQNELKRTTAGNLASGFVKSNTGATKQVLTWISDPQILA